MLKYLDNTGLGYFWNKIKSKLSDKADKVSNPTSGNFAGLDSNGNLTDSGHKHSDYLTQHQDISGKANKSEMSVVAGTGNDADKTTITLKTDTSATVLTSHQDISGKVSKVSSSTDNAVVRFDGTSGNIQNSGVIIDDSDQVTAAKFITDSGTNSQVVLGNGDLKDTKELSQYEEYLEWGGRNRSNAYGPLDSALISTLGANRLAFIKASSITTEYSRDGGTTWVDYGLTDKQKATFFAAPLSDYPLYLGKHSESNSGSSNDKLRITVDAYNSGNGVYSGIKKFVCYMATCGAQNCTWTLQVRNTSNFLNSVNTWTNVFTDEKLEGWSGINIVQTDVTIGSNNWSSTSNTQNRQFRLIFSQGTPQSGQSSARIYYVSAYGGVGWSTPSNMAKFGSIYSYDAEQNVTFPGKIIKKNGTSSQFLKADGSVDSNAYISDDSGFVHKSGEETVGGTKTFNGGVTVSGISGLTINESVLKIGQNSGISFERIYDNQNHAPYINGLYDTTNDEPYILFSGNYSDEKVRLVNIEEPRNNSDAATKYFVQNQGYITTSDLTTPLSSKADKVTSATSGNFASLDSNGNLEDSGYSSSSFATSAQGTKADTAIQSTGGNVTGDLVLKSSTSSGDTPCLVFQRGTTADSYYDWRIKNTSGILKVIESHGGTDSEIGYFSSSSSSGGLILYSGYKFRGELDGSISSSTTATTQSSGDSSTKVATTAFVQSEIHPEISSTEPSGGMIPNVVYNFGELSGNTTFTFASPTNNNILNHYYFCFDTPSTAPTITWPSGLTWYGGSDPTISASKHYEISVINNIACYLEV